MPPSQTFEAALAKVGQETTVVGAGTTGIAWALSNEALGLIGLLVAVIGLLVNVYFKRKEDTRQQLEHEIRVAKMMGDGDGCE